MSAVAEAESTIRRRPTGSWKVTNTEVLLFLLFAVYGPSFSLGGQFRYVEAIVLLLGLVQLTKVGRKLGRLEWWFVALFLIAAFANVFSGLFNGSPTSAIIARSGTYIIQAMLIPVLALLTNFDPRKILAVLLGYCFSYIFILYAGQSSSRGYAELPWRLGLGTAVTLAAAALCAIRPRLFVLASLLMAILGIVHLLLGGRAMSGVVLGVAAFCLIAYAVGTDQPGRVRPIKTILGVVAVLVGGWTGIFIMTELAAMGLLPDELAFKIERQSGHSFGMLASARPDTLAALYAITIKPVLGFGPGTFDPDVYAFYSRIAAETYATPETLADWTERYNRKEWSLGIPSHSHIFGAWADAGVAAMLSWLAVLILSIYVFVAAVRWRNAWMPLYLLVSMMNFWDIPFSPGPHRMDMAIRLLILFAAVRHILAVRYHMESRSR